MKKLVLFVLILITQTSCAVKLVPVDRLVTKDAKGIIIKVKEQKEVFFKDDLYTPIYLNIINNTDKKIKLTNKFFMMADDNNNQFMSVPLSKIVNKYEKNQDRKTCQPNCNNITSPTGSPGYNSGYATPIIYAEGYNSPYYPSFPMFFPYFSKDPYLYYKDSNGNFQQVPPTFNYPANQTMPAPHKESPELRGLRMEEIFPGYQVQGIIYFNQATRFAKKKVRLIINIPGFTEENEPLIFEFLVK